MDAQVMVGVSWLVAAGPSVFALPAEHRRSGSDSFVIGSVRVADRGRPSRPSAIDRVGAGDQGAVRPSDPQTANAVQFDIRGRWLWPLRLSQTFVEPSRVCLAQGIARLGQTGSVCSTRSRT